MEWNSAKCDDGRNDIPFTFQVEAATCPGGHCGVHRLQLVAVTDFAFQQDRNVTVELVLTSYGDSWWHGYRLPNITVTVRGSRSKNFNRDPTDFNRSSPPFHCRVMAVFLQWLPSSPMLT